MTDSEQQRGAGLGADDRPGDAARRLCETCDWQGAFELLQGADARQRLDPDELELLADCARWTGHNDLVVDPLERAHQAYGDAGDRQGALRTALGLCFTHMDAQQNSLVGSWWQRADRLIEGLDDCAEHGLHAWFAGRALGDSGDVEGHERHALRALDIARRFGDRNVEALALMDLGHIASLRGQSSEAIRRLDQATALALSGEIGLLETGFVFCNAIFACRARGEWDRAQEWTESVNRWVRRMQVSYFPGLCRVHRAEVLRIRGELEIAEGEASEAVRLLGRTIPRWVSYAQAELGEIRRRRGDLSGAMRAFRDSMQGGWSPQPGLALLTLAQGDAAAAHKSLERFAREATSLLICEDRVSVLRARCRVALAAGETEAAEEIAAALDAYASSDPLPWDRAAIAEVHGQLALHHGDHPTAIERLSEARQLWATLDAPFELASTCLLLGRALRADGDEHSAMLELESARGIFDRIGAVADRDLVTDELGAPEPRLQDSSAELHREGEYWSLRFDGRTLRLKDGLGPRYLATLIDSPAREFMALELASGGAAVLQSDSGEVIDDEARRSYRRRLLELRAELDQADADHDLGRAEQCRIEIDSLSHHLAAATGLGGRARRAGDTAERARQSVTKAIRTTIRKIDQDDEALGRYLSNTIRTGTACRFDPDPGRPVLWTISV